MPDPNDRTVIVSPGAKTEWIVEWPEGRSVLARKAEAVRLARQTSKSMAGRSVLRVLKTDGSLEWSTTHGSDRPPVTSYLQAARPRSVPAGTAGIPTGTLSFDAQLR